MKRLAYLLLTALIACSSKLTSSASNEQSDIDTIVDAESLLAWTADTIKKSNMPLVQLMDTLYRFVRSEEYFSNSLKDNVQWMNAYRDQLCDYYDRYDLGENAIPSYSKADSVMQSADRLWELDNAYSTMGIILKNDVERTRKVFRHYNEFSRLHYICMSQEQKQILEREFEVWRKLELAISEICANIIDLSYCGGTGAGPERTAAYLAILDAHMQLYVREVSWLVDNVYYETQGVYPECAKALLISCCQKAYHDKYSKEYAKEHKYYKEVADSASKAISELSLIIDKWLDARKEWENITGTDWSTGLYNLNSGEVLVRLSNIICLY